MQSTVNLQTVGLYSEPNQLNVPQGALTEASNVIIQRDNVIEPRRGFNLFGTTFGTITDRLKQLFVYKFRILRHWGDTLEFDTGTVTNPELGSQELFSPFNASVLEPTPGLRIKSVESNGNFYFTSSQGIRKISALTVDQLTTDPGFVTLSGGIKALDLTATPILAQGNITGFLPADSSVAYRVVWGTIDNNMNLILGVPSQRAVVSNSLNNLVLLDFNNTLQALQNVVNAGGSIISIADLVATLGLPDSATPQQLQANLIALANELDNNILLANDTGSGAPLTISAVDIVNNTTTADSDVATITFSAGNPADYWISGSQIFLNNFPNGETGSINGLQTVATVTTNFPSPGGTITFLTAATGNHQTFLPTDVTTGTPGVITIANHGFKNNDPIRFTNTGGALPTRLVAGTTYFAGGVTTNTFQVYNDAALTSPTAITVVGTGTNTVSYFFPVTGTSINSGEFRALVQPPVPNTPATDADLTALQLFLQQMINILQAFPSTGTPPIISASSQTNFVSILDITTSVNVKLVITIPQELTSAYFLQIYRSPIVTATGVTPLSDLTPSDELQLVYEAFPTAAELAARVMTVIDITPEQFLGADLYTNEASGVGIANANEDPPFALDINKFKNTVFLANTRTKYRMSLNLLGVSKMVTDFLAGDIPQLVISDGLTTNIYSFVLGIQQVSQVTVTAGGTITPGSYFLITASDGTLYYVWYNVDGVGADPMPFPGAIGVEVFVNSTDTAAMIASKTNDALNALAGTNFTSSVQNYTFTVSPANATVGAVYSNNLQDFTVISSISGGTTLQTTGTGAPTVSGNLIKVSGAGDDIITFSAFTSTTDVITITNNGEGFTTDISPGTSGFTTTTVTPGVGQKATPSEANFSTVADVADSLAGKYFTLNSAFNNTQYYIWYKVSGSGVDPLVPNSIGVEIDIVTNDSAATVASKTAMQLAAMPDQFRATYGPDASPPLAANVFLVSPFAYGPSNTATVGTSGFTLNSFTPGFLQVLLSNKLSPAQAVDETARSLVQVINRNPGEVLYAFYLSQASTVPGQMTLESRNLTTPKYYLLANNSDTGSSFSPDLSPKIAITSITPGGPLVNVVTTAIPHGLITGDQVVFSATDSTPNADGLWTVLYLTPTTFRINDTIVTPATMGEMIAASDAQGGDDEAKPNRIYYSTFQEPESFPLGNTIDVGDRDKAILRIFPVRDSLFVFKEDGLFRISGEVAPFTLQLFDTSCVLIAPDSVAISKNVIYGWTTQGILGVTEAGVSNPPASRPIDVDILPLTKENYPNFASATWGVGYESDNSYIVFTVQSTNDTIATIGYRYSTMTTSWTTYDKTDTCGIVDIADDKLYLGAGDTNSIEQERKTFSRHDYADRELASSLVLGKYFGNSMNLPDVSGFAAGDVLIQTQNLTIYEFNILLQKLNNDSSLQENQISSITTGSNPTITTIGSHFLTTGDFVHISNTQTTPNIDGLYQVTVTSSNQFTIVVTSPILTAGTVGLVKYSYFDSLKIVAGSDLQTALLSLAARLDIEPSLIYAFQTGNIISNSVGNPTILTLSSPDNLGIPGTTRKIRISGNTGSVPSINGDFDVIVIDPTHVSLAENVTVGGTGGSFSTLDDYLTAISHKSGPITGIRASNPTIITAPNHGMVSDRYVEITGTDSTPTANGDYSITLIDPNTFFIPLNVLIAGTTGFFITLDGTFQDVLTNYNYIISRLNADSGTAFKNYQLVTSTTPLETIITNVNKFTNIITTALTLDYVVGPLSIFKAIPTTFTYSPVTFQDPLNIKQVSEATLMFENKQFSTASLSFSSDLVPNFVPTPVIGNGNGNFGMGTGPFGGNFFGGGANAAPFRTYIPRDMQRCRYIVPQFTHTVALEKYSINGLTLTGTLSESPRAYR